MQDSEKEIEFVYKDLLNPKNDLKANDSSYKINEQFSISSNIEKNIIQKNLGNLESSSNNLLMDSIVYNKSSQKNCSSGIRKLRRIKKPLSESEIRKKYYFFKKKFNKIILRQEKITDLFNQSSSVSSIKKICENEPNNNINNFKINDANNYNESAFNFNNSNQINFKFLSNIYNNEKNTELKPPANDLAKIELNSFNNKTFHTQNHFLNGDNNNNKFLFNSNNLPNVNTSFNNSNYPISINNFSQNIFPNDNLFLNNLNMLNYYNNCYLLNNTPMINDNNKLVNLNNINGLIYNNIVPNSGYLYNANINNQLDYLKFYSDNLNRNLNFSLNGSLFNQDNLGLFLNKK